MLDSFMKMKLKVFFEKKKNANVFIFHTDYITPYSAASGVFAGDL